MIHISDSDRRRAFSLWLRTGRFPPIQSVDGIEVKFNPWHDPEDGRFTFTGTGQYYGRRSGSGDGEDAAVGQPKRSSQPTGNRFSGPSAPNAAKRASSARHQQAPAPSIRRSRGWADGGFTGGGGGSFGGGGATATGVWPDPKRRSSTAPPAAESPTPATSSSGTVAPRGRPIESTTEQFRTVIRNGYTYRIDARDRTRRVSGALTVAGAPVRSRTTQARAGGVDRRAGDDGGHYIAVRFNGPTEAFNHFAQDANFNRGGYRVLEDEWARDKRAGRTVTVKIVPRFDAGSVRPTVIDVWWTVDGNVKSAKFPNQRSESSRGRP